MTRLLVPFAWRGGIAWLVLRTAFYAFSGRDPLTDEVLSTADRLTLEPPAILAAAVLTVAIVFVDIAALREATFHANLGVDREAIAATVFLTVLALEILASTLVPVFV